jgi:hypothetical protein
MRRWERTRGYVIAPPTESRTNGQPFAFAVRDRHLFSPPRRTRISSGLLATKMSTPSQVDLLDFMTKFRTDAEAAIPTIEAA